jgi:hypothetical protein
MKTIRYTTSVDPDVRYSAKKFGDEIEIYLSDPDGWESMGYEFVRVETNPNVHIRLSSPSTMLHESGCKRDDLSCAELNGRRMFLNAHRWTAGSKKSGQDLDGYRQYLVSHEMGHILGHDHVKCPGPGQPAPIMMQQTLGIETCRPNTKLTNMDKFNR